MIIYRLTDRVPVKIGEVTFWISPLSLEQRGRIAETVSNKAGFEVEWSLRAAKLYVKFSVKEVEGLSLHDGSNYEVRFGDDGSLTDDCAEEILQVDGCDKLIRALQKDFGALSKCELEGVEVDFGRIKSVPKK